MGDLLPGYCLINTVSGGDPERNYRSGPGAIFKVSFPWVRMWRVQIAREKMESTVVSEAIALSQSNIPLRLRSAHAMTTKGTMKLPARRVDFSLYLYASVLCG
jgi:hypothetical protein